MCKKILHLPGRRNPQDIQDTMKAALVLVEQNQYTSISFPALGTGEMERVNLMLRDQMYDYLIVCSTIISSLPVIITTLIKFYLILALFHHHGILLTFFYCLSLILNDHANTSHF